MCTLSLTQHRTPPPTANLRSRRLTSRTAREAPRPPAPRRAQDRLVAQSPVSQALAESGTLEEVTPKILRAVCESLTWDLGELWCTDRATGMLRRVEEWHKDSIEAAQFVASSHDSEFLPGIGLP